VFYLGTRNVASNEELRNRWNGSKANERSVAIYQAKTNFIERAKRFLFTEPSPSNLQKYCELVELYEKIQEKKKKNKEAGE